MQLTGRIFILTAVTMLALIQVNCDKRDELDKQKEEIMTSQPEGNPVVVMNTSMGEVKIELWAEKAPITVENFLQYVDDEFYDGKIFHRVIKGFMIQGGGFDPQMKESATRAQIKNEASAEMKNIRGTIAMARTGVVDSATSQFFINHSDGNTFLDHQNETPQGFGYCAFGEVIEGMEVVDKIADVPTGRSGHFDDVPTEPVIITSIRRAE